MSKEPTPQFPLYAQDFLTGCMYLTNDEIGMYIKMLCKQWTDGSIPKKRVGFLLGINWDKVSEELKSKFVDNGETLINERLEQEREKRNTFKNKQRENGKKGGRPRKSNQTNNPNESQKKPLDNDNDKDNDKGKDNDKVEFQKIVDIFNSVCNNLPQVQKLTEKRKSSIKARISEYNLSTIGDVFQKVSQSAFLNGESERGWVADFDWVMNPNNFIKILEGKYNGKAKSTSNQEGPSNEYREELARRLGVVQSE